MGKSFKRFVPQSYDDDKFEKNAKGRHLKHSQNINTQHEDYIDPDEEFEYREELERFMHKWK